MNTLIIMKDNTSSTMKTCNIKFNIMKKIPKQLKVFLVFHGT